jgi:exosortase/archaeosortase family protein
LKSIFANFNEFYSKQTDLNRFIFKAILLGLIYFFYIYLVKIDFCCLKSIYIAFNKFFISGLRFFSVAILHLLGYEPEVNRNIIAMPGFGGIMIVPSCIGYRAMYLFASFIVIYYGTFKQKLAYIIIGLLVIFFFNNIRMVALVLLDYYGQDKYEYLVHRFTIKLVIVLLWLRWILFLNKTTVDKINN